MPVEINRVPHCVIAATPELQKWHGRCADYGCQQGNNRMNFPGLRVPPEHIHNITKLWDEATRQGASLEYKTSFYQKLVNYYESLGINSSYLCAHIPEYE